MKNSFYYIIFLLIFISSCSTSKNSFLNRNTHTLATKYNILYNGNLAFEEAKEMLDYTYEDNFWERLPIEPLTIDEDFIPLPGQAAKIPGETQGFERAEEKAVKAVQKHSMVIDGFEKNSQIDDAYLLLGKSRYYLQRYIPALEAFNFSIDKYPNANLYNDSRIWKSKTHTRLQNEELAIETLNLVLKNEKLSDANFEKAHTTLAMAYTQLDSIQLVIEHLKKSATYFADKNQSVRNLFILGQIYREENKIDSSNTIFEYLAAMKKIPRKYSIHATLERAKNYASADSTAAIVTALYDLIEDTDNREYFDELYYQAGLIAKEYGNENNAIGYFDSSLFYNQSKPYQKSLSYEKLGDIYFDRTNFKIASSFYDSVLQVPIDQNTKRIRKIIRKRESLNDVIFYEDIVTRSDSILTISAMTEEEQKLFFNKHIDLLKAVRLAEQTQKEKENANIGTGNFNNPRSLQGNSTFYFYNVSLVGFGKQQFKNKYGNRALVDNWIISNQNIAIDTKPKTENVVLTEVDKQKYELDYYLNQIPTSKKQLDSITAQRGDAYYNLGLIYKEQFSEYELAALNFEKFLANNTDANLVLPVKYQLHKTYENFDEATSNQFKNDILTNYPNSRYTQVILNPTGALNFGKDENSPEFIYKDIYICYQEGEYTYALSNLNNAIEKFPGAEIEAKFALLKAYLLLKTEGEKAFIDKLNSIIINYPSTEERYHAKLALEDLEATKK